MAERVIFVGKLTAKGQVTIPRQVRELLGVKPHDQVLFRVQDGTVQLQRATLSLEDTFGAVEPLQRPEDFRSLRERAMEEHVKQAAERLEP